MALAYEANLNRRERSSEFDNTPALQTKLGFEIALVADRIKIRDMKLEQRKFLRPNFTFEHDGKVLKVSVKKFFAHSSFEIKIKELSSNKLETSNFAIGSLLTGLLFLTGFVAVIVGGLRSTLEDDRIAMFFMSIFPLAIAICLLVNFWKKTYNFVHLTFADNGIPAVSFYKGIPTDEAVDQYIDELKGIIDGQTYKMGF